MTSGGDASPSGEAGTEGAHARSPWDAALDAIDEQLTATAAALAEGDDVPNVHWDLPDELGPMPPSVAPRARDLLARTERVQTEIDQRMARLKSELGALKHRRGALTAYVAADGDGRTTHTGADAETTAPRR